MDLIQNGRYTYLFNNREVFAIVHAWLHHESVIRVREAKLTTRQCNIICTLHLKFH